MVEYQLLGMWLERLRRGVVLERPAATPDPARLDAADPGRVRETAPALLHVLFYMQSAGGMEGAIDAGERAAAEILSLRPRRSVR